MKLSKKNNTLRIGVLGGIGPEASAYFYSLFIQRMQEKGLAVDNPLPEMVIYNLSVPEMTQEDSDAEQLAPYVYGIEQLNKLNVDFIVMVCNTIHLYVDLLQESSSAPILNLIEAVELIVESNSNPQRVLVLGTKQTIQSNLFNIGKNQQLSLTSEEVDFLSSAIENFNRGVNKNEQKEKVISFIKSKINKDDLLILGCTEFAVMLRGDESFNKIDTVSVLVDQTISNIKK